MKRKYEIKNTLIILTLFMSIGLSAMEKHWLSDFPEKRFNEFGSCEDAIVAGKNILHHSLLSPECVPDKVTRHTEEKDIPRLFYAFV